MSRCARERERRSPVRQSGISCVLLQNVWFNSRDIHQSHRSLCSFHVFSTFHAVINPVITALQIYVFWPVADAALYCTFIFWGWFSHGFRAARVIVLWALNRCGLIWWDRDLPWWAVTWPDLLLLFYFLFCLYCSFELFHVNLFFPSSLFSAHWEHSRPDTRSHSSILLLWTRGGGAFPLLSN